MLYSNPCPGKGPERLRPRYSRYVAISEPKNIASDPRKSHMRSLRLSTPRLGVSAVPWSRGSVCCIVVPYSPFTRSIWSRLGSLPPLPLGEGWGEGDSVDDGLKRPGVDPHEHDDEPHKNDGEEVHQAVA